MSKCAAITRSGTACKGIPIGGSPYCYAHSASTAEERRRHGARGGKKGGRGRPVAELGGLRDENADIRERLLGGELQPGVASVAIQSLNVDARLIATLLKAKEQEEILAEIEDLRRIVEANRPSGRGYVS